MKILEAVLAMLLGPCCARGLAEPPAPGSGQICSKERAVILESVVLWIGLQAKTGPLKAHAGTTRAQRTGLVKHPLAILRAV